MTCFIHVGVHKTGSTAIQKWADANRSILRSRGILYPNAGCPANQDIRFGQHELAWSLLKTWATSENPLGRLRDEIADSELPHVLISSEELNRLSLEQISELSRYLGDDVRVIFYYRNQSYVLQALYCTDAAFNQCVMGIEEYARTTTAALDYLNLSSKWGNVFGREHIIPLRYDRSSFQGGSIINDFLSNLFADEMLIEKARTVPEANPSLPWYVCQTLQHMWRLGFDRQFVYRVIRVLQKRAAFTGSQSAQYAFLPPSKAHRLDLSFSESNLRFRDEYCPSHAVLEPAEAIGDEDWAKERSGRYKAVQMTINSLLEDIQRAYQ